MPRKRARTIEPRYVGEIYDGDELVASLRIQSWRYDPEASTIELVLGSRGELMSIYPVMETWEALVDDRSFSGVLGYTAPLYAYRRLLVRHVDDLAAWMGDVVELDLVEPDEPRRPASVA